jgi:hypothetical protein
MAADRWTPALVSALAAVVTALVCLLSVQP